MQPVITTDENVVPSSVVLEAHLAAFRKEIETYWKRRIHYTMNGGMAKQVAMKIRHEKIKAQMRPVERKK